MTSNACPIWGTPATTSANSVRDGLEADSSRVAGKYFVAGTVIAAVGNLDELQKVLLTSHIVEQRRLGAICPEISSTTLEDVKARHPSKVHDRADNLLRYLANRGELLGSVVTFLSPTSSKAPREAHELMARAAQAPTPLLQIYLFITKSGYNLV